MSIDKELMSSSSGVDESERALRDKGWIPRRIYFSCSSDRTMEVWQNQDSKDILVLENDPREDLTTAYTRVIGGMEFLFGDTVSE